MLLGHVDVSDNRFLLEELTLHNFRDVTKLSNIFFSVQKC